MARVGGNSRILPLHWVLEPNVLLCTSCACHRKAVSTAVFPATASGRGLSGIAQKKVLLFLTGGAICSHRRTAWNQNKTEIWFVIVWSFWRSNGSHYHHLGFKWALCCSMTLLLLTSLLKVSPFNFLGTSTFVWLWNGSGILAFLLNSFGDWLVESIWWDSLSSWWQFRLWSGSAKLGMVVADVVLLWL